MDEHRPSQHPLIEQYLIGLERDLAARPDRHEVVEELRDHLLAATERNERSGQSPSEAERSAICSVGDPDVVARAFVENQRGVPAVPTTFTRAAGAGGYVAAVGALVAGFSSGMDEVVNDGGAAWDATWYSIGSVGILTMTVGLLVLLIGMVRRHGGLGIGGWLAIGVGSFGALVSIVAWAEAVWAGLVATSWLIALVATRRGGLAPGNQIAAIIVGLGSIPLLVIGSDELAQSGSGGSTIGDLAGPVLVAACVLLVATGAVQIGRWLSSEEPVVGDAGQALAA